LGYKEKRVTGFKSEVTAGSIGMIRLHPAYNKGPGNIHADPFAQHVLLLTKGLLVMWSLFFIVGTKKRSAS